MAQRSKPKGNCVSHREENTIIFAASSCSVGHGVLQRWLLSQRSQIVNFGGGVSGEVHVHCAVCIGPFWLLWQIATLLVNSTEQLTVLQSRSLRCFHSPCTGLLRKDNSELLILFLRPQPPNPVVTGMDHHDRAMWCWG